jgi:hypothetical protein
MTQPRSCGATFGAIGSTDAVGGGGGVMRTLTIRKPTGGTIVGEGISCGTLGSICTTTLSDGMAVALNIQTDPGFQFEQFTGDCTAEGKVTMSSSRECGASFAQPPAPIATTVRRPDPPAPPPGRRGNQGTQPPGSPGSAGQPGPSGTAASGSGGPQTPGLTTPPPGPVTPAPTPGLTGAVAGGAGDPAQKPPTPEISAEAHAKKEIDQLIKNYCAALETLQPNKLKELFPQVDVATHRELFRQYKSLKCSLAGDLEYERLDASPAGFAQVKAEIKQQLEMKSGGAPKVAELIYTLRVSRLSNSSPWMIERLQVVPKPK